MKYFAKYLPVEGEITKGDYRQENGHIYHTWDNLTADTCNKAGFKKVQLFLCSRDIQVGDKYYNPIENEWDECDSETRLEQIREQEKLYHHGRLKVIGPISPDATWVKEGDEFDEEELRKTIGVPLRFQIKGSCGHFH